MRTNLLLLIFLTTFCYTGAQEYAIGVKGGLNYYTIGDIFSRGGSIVGGVDKTFSPNKEMGTQLGAFLNVEFGKLFIRPELNFVSNKNNYSFPVKTSNWQASKIDAPLLIGYKLFDPISIYLGPSFSFFNEMTLDGANNNAGKSPIIYDKTTTNIAFGVMVDFKRFGIDLRFESGLKETMGEFGDNYQDFHNSDYGINIGDIWSYKPSQISLSLNIYLFRTNGGDIDDFFSRLFKGNKCWCPKN